MHTAPAAGSKVVIVGAGAFGLSTAYALSTKKGYDIWVFDRQAIPIPDAASTGIKKRKAYGSIHTNLPVVMNARYQQGRPHRIRGE